MSPIGCALSSSSEHLPHGRLGRPSPGASSLAPHSSLSDSSSDNQRVVVGAPSPLLTARRVVSKFDSRRDAVHYFSSPVHLSPSSTVSSRSSLASNGFTWPPSPSAVGTPGRLNSHGDSSSRNAFASIDQEEEEEGEPQQRLKVVPSNSRSRRSRLLHVPLLISMLMVLSATSKCPLLPFLLSVPPQFALVSWVTTNLASTRNVHVARAALLLAYSLWRPVGSLLASHPLCLHGASPYGGAHLNV